MWSKTINVKTGHSLYVSQCSVDEIPDAGYEPKRWDPRNSYSKFYKVQNGKGGATMLFVAKGHKAAPKQVCIFYRNGEFWSGYRNNIKDAINASMDDAWLCATRKRGE